MKDHLVSRNIQRQFKSCVLFLSLLMAIVPAMAQESVPALDDAVHERSSTPDSTALSIDSTSAKPRSLWSDTTARANELLSNALAHLGVRYRRGGESPDTGFDCSGLVRWAFDKTWGVVLPRRSEEIAHVGADVSKDELKPGDLVFFNTLKRRFSHIGIYVGDGQFVHAPRTGAAVRIESLNESYWRKRWNGARRIDTRAATSPGQP